MRALLALLTTLASACAAPHAPPDWSAIRTELARRVELDQSLRRQVTLGSDLDLALVERLSATDADNTAWMKDLVARQGWPTSAEVGAGGAGDAWLLVQHADHDVDFQEHCLALLADAVEAGQANEQHQAYLEDRVAMHRGRPQRYGTQFVAGSRGGGAHGGEGGFVPYTLADPARVDELRAAVGLGPLADYAARLNDRENDQE